MSHLFLKSSTRAYVLTKTANLLTYTQATDNAAWSKTNCTSVDGATDPVSGTDAETVTATNSNATLTQSQTLPAGTYTFSVYIKRKTGTGAVSISVDGSTWVVKAISGSWTRWETNLSISAGTVTPGVKIATNADAVYVYGAQLEYGNSATTYAANTANRYSVAQVTDADYPGNTCRGTAYLDGRVFVMAPNGDVYQSADGDFTSWAATEFIGADIEPDKGMYLAKWNSYIMALKAYSCQFYYDAANATGSILSPAENMAFRVGCASADSVKEVAGSVAWLGQTKDGQGRSIYLMTPQGPQAISTPSVDRVLTHDDLASVNSWVAKTGAHVLYGITLGTSGVTLVYDFSTKMWSYFSYLAGSADYKVVTAVSADGEVTCADHGYTEQEIVQLAGAGDFSGFRIVQSVIGTDTFKIGTTGAAFSGWTLCQNYSEEEFPIVCSTSAGGIQWMATNGNLYIFDQYASADSYSSVSVTLDVSEMLSNLLSYPDDFYPIGGSGTWDNVHTNVTQDAATDPSGSSNADRLHNVGGSAYVFQVNSGLSGTFLFSVYLKREAGSGPVYIGYYDGPSGSISVTWWTLATLSTSWKQFSLPCIFTGTTGTAVLIYMDTSGDKIFSWGARLESASSATPGYISSTFSAPCMLAKVRPIKFDGGSSAWKFMHEAEIVADKTDSDIYLRWSDDDFASYSPWRQINLRDKRARTRRLGRTSRRTFELRHLDNKPLRLEALELTIGD